MSSLKYWYKCEDGAYTLIEDEHDRVIEILPTTKGFRVEEGCDNYFGLDFTKDGLVSALRELADELEQTK